MMKKHRRGWGFPAMLVCGLALLFATPAAAQLVLDGNIFWNNDGGSYSSDTGGANCPGGAYSVTTLATVYFSNQTIDPLLNPQHADYLDPRWDPQLGSPALAGNPNSRVVKASNIDPWFQDVCYVGALPYTGGDPSRDWTAGWTYFNYNGGLGRTDIDTTKTTVTITSDVNANTTWTNNNNYVLVGRVAVNPPATLTIESGTVILGSGVGSYLVVERGADIDAQGTVTDPIIFTSGARWQEGLQTPGDWGGVVLHGQAIANCVGGCGSTAGGGDCVSEGGAGDFGGNDDTDSSGIIRYARVEYAGQEISPNNELNAWTMNAVGSGTVLEHMQAHLGTDDLFEWFGGTARLRYAVATGGDDDNLDWQMGYRGFVQFAVCKQAPDYVTSLTDRGIEADNNEFDFECQPESNPVLSNLTLVGTVGEPGGDSGMRLRRGTNFTVINSIVTGFSAQGVRVSDDASFANCAGTAPGDLACATLAVGDDRQLTGRLIARAAPNPTAGPANISFDLPRSQNVKVQVFDVAGRLVDTLADGPMSEGAKNLRWEASSAPAGLYFYTVQTESGRATGKLVVAR